MISTLLKTVFNWWVFFFSSRRRHTRWNCDWSSDVCSSDLADPLFASIEAVAGGTLAYAKDVWRQVGGYPDASIGEDVGLMRLMADAGARIAPTSNQGAYVYIRHGRNSWRYDFDPGQ